MDWSQLRVGDTIQTVYGKGVVTGIVPGCWVQVRYGPGRELTLEWDGRSWRIGGGEAA